MGHSWRLDPEGAPAFEAAIAMHFHQACAPCRARLSSLADATAPAYWYSQDTHTSRGPGSPWAPLSRATDVNACFLSSFLSLSTILHRFYQLVNGHLASGNNTTHLCQFSMRNLRNSLFSPRATLHKSNLRATGSRNGAFCPITTEAPKRA